VFLITVVLIASLLCAESPNGSLRDRYLIVQTIRYRSEFKEIPLVLSVTQKGQYQGLSLVNWELYRIYRQFEIQENVRLTIEVLTGDNQVKVSNFCSIGSKCSWESSCKLLEVTESHKFYLCPEWE